LPANSDSVNALIACGWSPRGLYLLTISKGIGHESNTAMAIRNIAHRKRWQQKPILVQSHCLSGGPSDKLHRN